jgi:colicin import membrane protein
VVVAAAVNGSVEHTTRAGVFKRYRPRRLSPGAWRAIVYALLVHLAALAVFALSLHLSRPERPAAAQRAIEAVVVSPPPDASPAPPKADAEAEARRREQQEEEMRRRQAEEAHRAQQEAERRRQLALEKRQEEERRRREREQETERRRAAAALEAERKQRAEEEKKRRAAAEELARQRQAEEALRAALEAEERARTEAARRAQAAAAADRYKVLIRQKVERHWSRPAGSRQGLECIVRVRLTPGGEVIEARVVRSSGNAVFDRSVESAVFKASPLPVPDSPELFEYFRELDFIFRPEG